MHPYWDLFSFYRLCSKKKGLKRIHTTMPWRKQNYLNRRYVNIFPFILYSICLFKNYNLSFKLSTSYHNFRNNDSDIVLSLLSSLYLKLSVHSCWFFNNFFYRKPQRLWMNGRRQLNYSRNWMNWRREPSSWTNGELIQSILLGTGLVIKHYGAFIFT